MDIPLILLPTSKLGARGQIYDVIHENEVIASGVSPEFVACRVLKDRGIAGRAVFWRSGKPHWDIAMSIERGAGLAVTDPDKGKLAFVKWSPHPMAEKREAA